MTLKR